MRALKYILLAMMSVTTACLDEDKSEEQAVVDVVPIDSYQGEVFSVVSQRGETGDLHFVSLSIRKEGERYFANLIVNGRKLDSAGTEDDQIGIYEDVLQSSEATFLQTSLERVQARDYNGSAYTPCIVRVPHRSIEARFDCDAEVFPGGEEIENQVRSLIQRLLNHPVKAIRFSMLSREIKAGEATVQMQIQSIGREKIRIVHPNLVGVSFIGTNQGVYKAEVRETQLGDKVIELSSGSSLRYTLDARVPANVAASSIYGKYSSGRYLNFYQDVFVGYGNTQTRN